jgi:tetratricopeptide (TPR) repeat protein
VCPTRSTLLFITLLFLILVLSAGGLHAQDVWNGPAFSADARALRQAAEQIKPGKDAGVTVLLNEYRISLDSAGKMLKKHHMIYRIESQDGIEGWSEVRGTWDPWYQAKPKLEARVITPDGVVHPLDPKTLNEVPVHENSPDVYTDRRAYGGPLPALAPAAIIEEEVTTEDTAIYFSGGIFESFGLAWDAPVNKTRFVLSHPESLPVRYVMSLLPEAVVNKTSAAGTETIVIDQGPMEPYSDGPSHVPSDAVLYPELQLSTGGSWQQMASVYARQVSEKLRTSDVQPLVSKLELRAVPNLEIIGKIVAALHKTVRYTGIEFGESSIVPQFPGETLKRKYGDCKDKATLLVAMLRAAGIPANLALLSAGPGEDINPDLPGMGGFDHAIVYIPATSSSPELWIDATAQYSRVGVLPEMDYGRWALIVDEKTTGLKKIPELAAEDNRHVETREFALAEYGPAKIVEKDEQFGPAEEDYRNFYSGDPKKLREGSEKYVKNEYLADSLASFEKSDPGDLEKPFIVSFGAKGRRGFTDMDNAFVYIPQAGILDGLPDYFYSPEKVRKEEESESKPKPRTVDWAITPFTTEWRYKIVAPAGFKVRALPANKDEHLGTAHFVQEYSASEDGAVVEAVLRFDTGKARLTVDEARALRDALLKARQADGTSINFDQIGQSLLAAGKIKDALATDRRLVVTDPKNALQRVRLARALLAAGLGEKARAVMKEAVALSPKSAQVFSEQGWLLQHDLIGRRFGKGFDYAGAVAALRKAKQLDAQDNAIRANLAILLEYDAEGLRYSKHANLDGSITEFKELKQLDENYAKSYEDSVAYDLCYLERFKELHDYVNGLPATDARKALLLASIAAMDGADAAIKMSLEITSDEQSRSRLVVAAGRMLAKIRKYPEAAGLLVNGAHGQMGENQIASFAAALAKTKPYQQLKIDNSSPVGPIQNLFVLMFGGTLDWEKFKALMSKEVLQSSDVMDGQKEWQAGIFHLRSIAAKSDLTLETMADLALSTAHFSQEGDESLGYKVTVQTVGAPAMDAFVVREDGRYKLVEFSSSAHKVPESIGWEVLARLEKKDLVSAKKWLDWARDKVHINTGDDPLSGQPFPHFWTKGQDADEAILRTAALLLLPSKELKDHNLQALVDARNRAQTDGLRTQLNLALAYAYRAQENWTDLRQVASELMKTSPDSIIAFQFAARADAGLKQFDDWQGLLQVRLEKHADEPDYTRSAAELARYRGQFGRDRELMKALMDNGKAGEQDLNVYAWDALYASGAIDPDAIEAARRANDLTKNSNFPMLHTLACLYAVMGKTAEARDLLLKAMDAASLEEPNSDIWLGLGLIAEQYGEADAARAMYGRVEKQNPDGPNSEYVLAQQRLAALAGGAASAKATGP